MIKQKEMNSKVKKLKLPIFNEEHRKKKEKPLNKINKLIKNVFE